MIYPMLAMLEDLGQVSAVSEGNKKLYAITRQGQEFLDQNRAMVAAIEKQIAVRCSDGAQQVRERLHLLRDAVCNRVREHQLLPDQIRQIEDVLDKALTEIQAL
jgi:DNA-binding PadR family transcriptional regulator